MRSRHLPSPRRLQPLHAWLLAVLLLAAQALGLAHRVAHAPGLPAAVSAQAAAFAAAHVHAHADVNADAASAAAATASAHGQHEAGGADCRLIDQLAHADALCGGDGLPPPLLRTSTIGTWADVPALPLGSAAAYLARGPPASA